MSERHREALAHLVYGWWGAAASCCCPVRSARARRRSAGCFLEQIPANCNVAYIFNPKLTVTELLQSVCDEFHIPIARKELSPPTVKDYLDPLNEFLLKAMRPGATTC
jgi:general secretion pathway protein A